MKTGDLVRRKDECLSGGGLLAIVIETEWNPRCEKIDVYTLEGYKEYWYRTDCEVISESR